MNYIDNWLILAQSHQAAVRHRDVVLAHMKELGLRLNAKKSVLSPLQRTTFLGVAWDSTSMQAHLSPARIESILSAVKSIRLGQSLTVKQFQRLLGLMAAASNVPRLLCSRESWREFAGTGFYYCHCPVVARQSMVPRYNIPSRRASSRAPRQEGPSVPSGGLEISPPTRTVETVGLPLRGPSS